MRTFKIVRLSNQNVLLNNPFHHQNNKTDAEQIKQSCQSLQQN